VELMTSGAFARASGLSRKALRLYDELGLLHPARVDPETLYRFYDPGQLEQARLVAWLRRLGMPLAVIRSVSGLPPAQAAEELAAYWAKVEAETAARRELAVFLIGYLSGKDPGRGTAMSDGQGTLTVRYGVRSDIGLHREDNEDAAYAGARLLAVADGMGGHAAGEVASAAVIEALRPLDTQVPAGELLNALDHAVRRANTALRDMVQANPALDGMGTTVTALLWSGSQLGLLHIGDSRAYLVRDGELFQITQDHTLVQSLLDEGKITAEEVASHPQRMLLLRALTGDHSSRPDLQLRQARPGDRYLLSSDGLHAVVPADAIARGPAHRGRSRRGRHGPGRPGHRRRRPGQHHLHRGRRRRLVPRHTPRLAWDRGYCCETERIGTCRHYSTSGRRTGWRPARATATR
jgi:protein phosphatase